MFTSSQIPLKPKKRILKILLPVLCFFLVSGVCDSMDSLRDSIDNYIVGQSDSESPEVDKKLPPGNSMPGGDQAAPGDPTSAPALPIVPGGGGSGSTLKPVSFRNLGTVAFTVSAWTYEPLDSADPPIPSNASTVAMPGGNTSSSLSLPLGTYTWCYWWELGDINEDGMIEYAHALDERPVTLDQADSDDLSLAETVDLAAPADTGISFGLCGFDISQFVVDQLHADKISGALITMAHDTDFITLRGPITISYWYIHVAEGIGPEVGIGPGVPTVITVPVIVVIPAGETRTYELVERRGDHPGDWNMYIWLISVDE
jgi:hypothetical protein